MSETDPIPPVPTSDAPAVAVAPVKPPEPAKFKGKLPRPGDQVMVSLRSGVDRFVGIVANCDAQGTVCAFVIHGRGTVGAEIVRGIYPAEFAPSTMKAPHRWYPRT